MNTNEEPCTCTKAVRAVYIGHDHLSLKAEHFVWIFSWICNAALGFIIDIF